jgi:hypothetical protein
MKDEASYPCESWGEEVVVPIDLCHRHRQCSAGNRVW